MSTFKDLVRVALTGLLARKVRTLLLLLGPMIGVAAIIASVGLTDSAKGDLKQKVSKLGTNLIEAAASSSFGGQNPTLPTDAVERALTVTTVEKVSAVVELSNIVVTPYDEAREKFETVPIPVLGTDENLPSVLQVNLVSGRWINQFDEESDVRAAVIGVGLAREFDVLPGENRTIDLNGIPYGVIGILNSVELEPGFDNAVFISFARAEKDFLNDDVEPNKMYVRCTEGTEAETSAGIVFLLSPAAAFISGTTLRIDGARPQVRMGWPMRVADEKAQARDAIKPFNGFHRASTPKVFQS